MRVTIAIILATAWALGGCRSRPDVPVTVSEVQRDGIYDFTAETSATCEVHGGVMSPRVVDLDFGMKPITEMVKARWELFPHADEPYDTRNCMGLPEKRGRVFVCDRCTEARAAWMSTHPTALR